MTKEVKKLWQVDTPLHPLVQQYTAGDDVIHDQVLLPYDIQGTKAHAKMLLKKGIFKQAEYNELVAALDNLIVLWQDGKFVITPEQEDAHTAIEQYLTEQLGDIGKKVHTGRSRNDQATVMVRLYLAEQVTHVIEQLNTVVTAFEAVASHRNDDMPGYTHMQKAMPTTVKVWLKSYADALRDANFGMEATAKLIDQNPLGSASGFGIANFDNDRQLTAKELGFGSVQDNPQYVGLSRGLFEYSFLQSLSYIMLIVSRFASDMMLFTTQEFNYFSLPNEYTTGSSIMPHKRNYDLFEIMRANTATVLADQQHISGTYTKLMSGYNRDLQTIKASLMRSTGIVNATLELLAEVVPKIQVNKTQLADAMTDDLYVTEQVYELVKSGMPFREAYLEIKKQL